jgi:uncharacterized protein YkwD
MLHFRWAQRPIMTSLVILLAACGGGGEEAPTIGRQDASTTAGSAADPTCGIAGFAEQMQAEVNRVRTQGQQCGGSWQAPVAPLQWHGALANAAAAHSSDMAAHNFVSHTGSDGSSVSERAAAQGYGAGGVGENLGGGQKDVGHLMRELLASPPHCANLMRPDYRAFGAACVRNPGTDYQRHWTQVFGQ